MQIIEDAHFLVPKTPDHSEDNFFTFYDVITPNYEWDKKISIGSDFVCRYCGETNRKFFKKDNSHTFPEFVGNKWLFSKDECTKCNQHFSIYENELGRHGHVMRTLLGTKTKKGGPTKYKSNAFEIQKNENGFEMKMQQDPNIPIDPKKHGEFIREVDFTKHEESARIIIPQMKFIPFYLLKCLVKIGFGIMPDSELTNNTFDDLKSWLLDKGIQQIEGQVSPFHYIYHVSCQFGDRKPLLQLYKKREEYQNSNMPSYSLIFGYGNDIFQIFLPYCDVDKWIFEQSKISLPIMPILICEDGERSAFHAIDGGVIQRVNSGVYKKFPH